MSLSPAFIWNAAAIAIGAVGGVLLLWAMFWDRARGRLRCPKCWYDMRGVVEANTAGPWTCPECGRVAKSSARLRRTRKRKWIAVLAAVVVALGAYAPLARDRIITRGWIGAIPTTLLVVVAPVGSDAWELYTDESFDGTTWSARTDLRPDSSPLLRELMTRFDESDIWLVHWRVLFRRVMAAMPEVKAELCESRDAWPRGEHVFVKGAVPFLFRLRDYDLRIRAASGRPATRIDFDPLYPDRFEGSLGPADRTIKAEVEV